VTQLIKKKYQILLGEGEQVIFYDASFIIEYRFSQYNDINIYH